MRRHNTQPPRTSRSHGFTILELMIATSIFSVILLVAAAGILRFSNDYYRGVNESKTQAAARAVINDISQGLQLSETEQYVSGTGSPATRAYCIDSTVYNYVVGPAVSASGQHALVKDDDASCPSSPSLSVSSGGRELLSEHMRLADLSITQLSADTYTVSVTVAYGDDDLLITGTGAALNAPTYSNLDKNVHCKGGTGGQYCAVASLTTTVQQRL